MPPTFGALSRTHDEYDAAHWARLRLLYKGGYAILDAAAAKSFLPKLPGESDEWYGFRLKQASYMNHAAKVVGYITGALFSKALQVVVEDGSPPDEDFYREFWTNCDLQGTDFSQFLRERAAKALWFGKALVCVDMPKAPEDAVSRLDEEAAGAGRAYVYALEPETLINWKRRDVVRDGKIVPGGAFDWAILKSREVDRSDPLGDHESFRFVFRVWQMIDGRAHFSKYQTQVYKKNEQPQEQDELELVQPPSPTSFDQVPILELRLPEGVCMGELAGPLCEENYRDRSHLKGDMARSLNEIPYVGQGSEVPAVGGALPSAAAQDPNRGKDPVGKARKNGFIVLGAGDQIGFAGPSGTAHQLTVAWIDHVKDDIMHVTHLMALSIANSAAALSRSGESKAEDRNATEIVLGFIAYHVREFALRLMDCVAHGRSEDVEWSVTGLDTFTDDDRTALVDEGAAVPTTPAHQSKTFKRLYWTNYALALVPHATEEQKRDIRKELEEHFEKEPEEPAFGAAAQRMLEQAGGMPPGNAPGMPFHELP